MKTELKYGLIIGALMIGGIYAEYYAHVPGATLAGPWVLTSFVVLIIGVVLGIRAKKNEFANGLTYKEAFMGGITIAFIAGVIIGCYAYFYVNTIDPDFVARTSYAMYKKMKDSGVDDAEAKRKIQDYTSVFSPASQFISGVGMTVIVGAVVAAIASFFFRRKNTSQPS